MQQARVVVLGVIVAGAAACSLLVDVDGFSDGALAQDGGGSEDGKTASDDGGFGDAGGADGSSSDGGPLCPPVALPATCDPAFLADSRNCCVAGHDCGGGSCVNGSCQPVTVVANATTDARLLGLHKDTLVWATGCSHEVRRVRTDGAGNTALPAGLNCTPTVAVNGDGNAYWIEYDGPNLNVAPIDGAKAAEVIATVAGAGTRSNFARLAVDATRAYWATTTPPAIWFSALTDRNVAPKLIAKTNDTSDAVTEPFGVAVDATHVYWSDRGANLVRRRALASLGNDVLADVVSTDLSPRDLTLDANRVYWLTADGLVRARAKDLKDAPVTLASGQVAAESIIVDDRYVYWTTWKDQGAVSRTAKTGGPVQVLAANQSYAYGITQDCGTIYWTNHANFGTGQVMKIAK